MPAIKTGRGRRNKRRKNKKFSYEPRYYKGEGSPFQIKHKFDDQRVTIQKTSLKGTFKNAIEDLKNRDLYELGDLVGWSGLEKYYESFLRGTRGTYFYEVDASGREVGSATELNDTRPSPGGNIQTTIDLELQMHCEKLMKDKRGVILVGEPLTGGILAAISSPDYPPDFFTGLITESEWNNLKTNPDKPLINRYIQGKYIPGSIVKMITQIALLNSPQFNKEAKQYCPGFYQFVVHLFWVSCDLSWFCFKKENAWHRWCPDQSVGFFFSCAIGGRKFFF